MALKSQELKFAAMPDLLSVALTFPPQFVECLPEGDPLCFPGTSGIVASTRQILSYFKVSLQASTWIPRHYPVVVEWTGPAQGPAVGACAFSSFASWCPPLARTFVSGVILRPIVATAPWMLPGVL